METNLEQQKEETERRIRRRLEELPMLPTIVAQLMALDRDSEGFFEELLGLLERDPPFAARVLRLVNSVVSAPSVPIISLRAALSRLGGQKVIGFITSAAVTQVFVPTTQGQRNLWIHALQVATAARAIADRAQAVRIEPEHAYIAGLLHDVGRFVMFRDSPKELQMVNEAGWSSPKSLMEAERGQYGYDHTELGWLACRTWCMPENVAVVVRDHHRRNIEVDDEFAQDLRQLIMTVQVADALSTVLLYDEKYSRANAGERKKIVSAKCISARWKNPPVTAAELVGVVDQIVDETEWSVHALGIGQS